MSGQVGSSIVFAHVFPLGLLSSQNSASGAGTKPHGGTSSAPVANTTMSASDTRVIRAMNGNEILV